MNREIKLNASETAHLCATRLMAGLPSATRRQLLAFAGGVVCEPRDILLRDGEPAEFFYCVLSGYIRLYRLNKDGREADIRLCGPGDTFAECLLYGGGIYRYNAQAAETATLACFDMRKVRELAEREGEVGKALMTTISNSLLNTMDVLANDRLNTAPQRLAHYLLEAYGENGEAASIRLPFQKSLLAGKLGLAPEALSRAFSTLRQSGVSVRGRVVKIEDPAALRLV